MNAASVHRFSGRTKRQCPRRQSLQRKPVEEVFAIAKSSCTLNVIDRNSCKTTDREPLCAPLRLGPKLELWPPVLAAPMAGISCAPYRKLCTSYGAQLAISEMVIASSFLLRNRRTAKLASFAPDEATRSVQIYGVRPEHVREAVRRLVYEHGVSHVDMNFGCPVRKITARGGGSALPLRPKLFGRLVAAAVAGAEGAAPVTVKFRIGLTPELTTHLQAGRIAEAEGAAALTLHARTADQLYYPPVDWSAIRQLVQAVRIPVIGNGDVYEGRDAVRMVRETGCAGIMVGRAALGRPWVYGEVAAALEQAAAGDSDSAPGAAGSSTSRSSSNRGSARDGGPEPCSSAPPGPRLGEVVRTALQRHVEPEVAWYGDYDEGERDSLLRLRKFVPLYLHGYTSAAPLRAALLRAETLDHWRAAAYDERLYDADEPYPSTAVRFPRLKGGGVAVRQSMGLPNGWLGAEGEGGLGAEAEVLLADDVCEG